MKTKLLAGFSLIGNSTTNFMATPFATLPYKQDRIHA